MSFKPAANNMGNSNVNSSEDDDDFVLISCHNDRNEFADELNDHKIKSGATTLPFQQNIHNDDNTMLFNASNIDKTDRYVVHSLYENEVIPLVTSCNEDNNINDSEHADYHDENNNMKKVYQETRSSSNNSSSSTSEFIEICGSTPKRHTMSPSEAERYTNTPQSYRSNYQSYCNEDNNYDYDVYDNVNIERVKDIINNKGANTKTSACESNPADEEEMCMTRVHSVVCLDTNTQLVQQTSSNSHDKLISRVSNSTDHHGNNNNNNRSEHNVSIQENELNCHFKETILPHPSAPSESSLSSSSESLSSISSSESESESEEPTYEQHRELPNVIRKRSRAHVTRHCKNANREETDEINKCVAHKHYAGGVSHTNTAASKCEQIEKMHKLTTSYQTNLSIATFVRMAIQLI